MSNILVCFGTRPEYIKVKSIIDNIKNVKTCFTGQHVDLLKEIKVDYKLEISDNVSSNRLNNIILNILSNDFIFNDIDYVMVQGDTTTACAISIAAFNCQKKVIHLEAGLRSGDLNDPFPEEMNRQVISRIAYLHLCPTPHNKKNLISEKIKSEIHVVGNTGLDNIDKTGCSYGNKILITLHRRDNIPIMDKWFSKIEDLAILNPDLEFIIPLHPNPDVKKHKNIFKKVKVIDPLPHDELIDIIKECRLVISDSGGLQEECSFLNKKIIVCRKTTERPESVGVHSFLCEDPDNLTSIFDSFKDNYIINKKCPYGDGKSWKKIEQILVSRT